LIHDSNFEVETPLACGSNGLWIVMAMTNRTDIEK
jgi:hypothetical protein